MFHHVQTVEPQPGMTLRVTFRSGDVKLYDVKPLLARWEAFQALAQVRGLFEQVHVDQGGYGISWNEDIDLSCNELWENGVSP